MKVFGIALIVLGLVGLLYGGITWTHKDKVIDAGPIEVTADKHERLPLPPIVAGYSWSRGSPSSCGRAESTARVEAGLQSCFPWPMWSRTSSRVRSRAQG